MRDLACSHYFQQILVEASQFRTLHALYQADPRIGPGTVDLFQRIFKSHRNDPVILHDYMHATVLKDF
jgi:hypothetical protein